MFTIKLVTKLNKIATLIMLTLVTCIFSANTINAQENLEKEFQDTINKYKSKDIIVKNGISLRKGENLKLPEYIECEMSNYNVVKIDKNGVLHVINEGTVFLSKEIDGKVNIMEIYVPKNTNQSKSYSSEIKLNRNYYKVFVDAGHGGSDNGASGNGYLEDELNLQIAKRVEEKLKKKGMEVMMSRTNDKYLLLGERSTMANEYGADIFVSIHQNSADNTSAIGIETFHHINKANHKPYAHEIQTNAIAQTGARNRGVKSANFAVLRETYMPASLFESGFISNYEECKKLGDPIYQDKLATAISDGIEKYLKDNIILDETLYPTVKIGVVKAEALNIRSGYGTSYPVIGKLTGNTSVEVVESTAGWHKIIYNQGFGYVSGSYIELDPTVREKPVIHLEDKTITLSSEFDIMEGVIATDKEDGDITSKIIVSGTVDTNTPGNYELVYTVIDSDRNKVNRKRNIRVEYKQEDVNKDCGVDIIDLSQVAMYYNKNFNDSDWKVELDFNNDNIIDIFDLIVVSSNINNI